MPTNSMPPENLNISENTNSLESSLEQSQVEVDLPETLLPRSAWNSQLAYLRAVFRAKKALDRIEKEAAVLGY
jgi:hypothetical protein